MIFPSYLGSLILKIVVAVPDVKLPFADWVAVIEVVPACKIVTIAPDIVTMLVLELAYENAPTLFEVG